MKFDPKSHAHITRLRLIDLPDGSIGAFDNNGLEAAMRNTRNPDTFEGFISHRRLSVDYRMLNMMQAGPLLYQNMTAQYQAMERLKDALRAAGVTDGNPFIGHIDAMQDSILLCQSAAREGLMKVSKQLDKEQK